METIESNSQILHFVSRRPIRFHPIIICVGLFFVFCGIVSLFAARLTTLDCRRTSGTKIECVRSFVYILGNKTSEKIPGSLQAAGLDFLKDKKGKITTRVTLKTTTNDLNLNDVSSPDNSYLVNRLNDFIKDPQANNIKIEQDNRYIPLLMSVFSLGIPGLVLFWICLFIPVKVSCKLDRYLDRAFIDKKYILYSKHREISPLSRIKEVGLKEAYQFGIGHQEVVCFNIVATLENGKKYSISTLISELGLYEETFNTLKINNFLAIAKPEI